MARFNPKFPPKPLRRAPGPVGKQIRLATCQPRDRVMGLAGDAEAEVEFVRTTTAGRVAVIYWTPVGASYRELDPDVQVKLVRREAVAS
jgi:hypothetical protein